MSLKKNFLHIPADEFRIPTFRRIAGIFIGLSLSFTLYAFFYVIRETFRLFSITEESDIWVLSDPEVHFYNLILAFIAVIFGQSYCIMYWLETPHRFLDRFYRRKSAMINDQRALNWYFLFWFFKISTFLGFLFCFGFKGWQYNFPIYPKYNFLFILILIVLFFQSWTTIRFTFKKLSIRWMIISLTTVSILSFSLSRVNFVNYKRINESVLDKCIPKKYNIKIPESYICSKLKNLYLVYDLYLVPAKYPDDSTKPVLFADGELIQQQMLNQKILELKSRFDDYDIAKITIRLKTHASVPIRYVNQLKYELVRNGIHRLAYAVTPDKTIQDLCSNPPYYFIEFLPYHELTIAEKNASYRYINSIKNSIDILQYNNSDSILFNNVPIPVVSLRDSISKELEEQSDCWFKLNLNKDTDVGFYIKFSSLYEKIIDEQRDKYAKAKYNKIFQELDYTVQAKIEGLFPFHMLVIPEDYHKDQ